MQVPKTTHKLLIEAQLDPMLEPNAFLKKYLTAVEVLTRHEFRLKLKFTNIGTEIFTGGKITSFKIIYGEAVLSDVIGSINPTVEPLDPEQSKDIIDIGTVAQYYDLAWIKLQMVADDGNPIEYYQSRENKVHGGEWVSHFYVLSKSEVLLIGIYELLGDRKV